jgi:hypothetical protein
MTRIWNTPVFILATMYFIVDGVFSYVTHPVSVWIAKKETVRAGANMGDVVAAYSSLALFSIPVIILEPAKPLVGYLIGTGHSSLAPLRSSRLKC